MPLEQLKIIGCGGHSKVVIDALSLLPHAMQVSLCDSNQELLGTEVCGLLVDSTLESLANFSGLVHVAIGNNMVRSAIVASLNKQSTLLTVIHPAAQVSKSAQIEAGSFIAAMAVLGPESYVAASSIINHGAIIDHEVRVGAYSHIAPNSTLGGQVIIGKGVLVGAGATILPGLTIGDGATIAAGAVVIKNVTPHTIVKGIPAA